MTDHADDNAYQERVKQGLAAMVPERRKALLLSSIYGTFRRGPCDWGVIGENGVVSLSHPTEEDAENYIIEGMGIFD
jgi:hypothetical protein